MNHLVPTGAATLLPQRRRRALLLSTAFASVAAGLLTSGVAFAGDECGPPQQGVVTCTQAGSPYPDGIEYVTPAIDPTQDPGLDLTVPVYDLTVNLDAGVVIRPTDSTGVALIGFNNGGVTLNSAPGSSIVVDGVGVVGVLASTNYGDITINTESLTASGRASSGVNANSNTGDISVNAGSIAVSGNGALGVSANSYAGDVTINAGSVDVTGYYAGGINAYVGNGDLVVVADRVTTSGGSVYGIGSNAVDLTAVGGDITVAVGEVATQADYSTGVRAVSFGTQGAVSVTVGDLATTGFASTGLLVQGGSAEVDAGVITTSGDYSYGAVMFSTGAGGATLNAGEISTAGQYATAALVKAYNGGAATVTVGTVTTVGDNSGGVYAYSDAGAVEVTVDQVSTVGAGSFGIQAIGGESASVTAGAVTTTGDNAVGILATTPGAGDVTVTADTVNVSGSGSDGVIAIGADGDVGITVANASTAGDYTFALAGVARGTGDVSIVSTGSIATTGDFALGVYAVAAGGGNASATVNEVSTDGFGSHAVYVAGQSVDVTVNGDISTAGTFSYGVIARAIDGMATVVNNGSISTAAGGGTGIFAYASDGVTISGTGAITTQGGSATGIVAYGFNGPTTITTTSITTSGDYSRGVQAQGSGDVTVNLGSVSTNGRIASAIEAATFQNGTGPLAADLNVTVGSVVVNGDYSQGINVFSSNNGVVNIDAGTVVINGTDGVGILSQSFTADTTINADTVVTTGAGDAYSGPLGISATSDTGDISITSSKLISTQGLNGIGILAATAGDVTISVNEVSAAGDNAPAIFAVGGSADVTINGDVSTSGANSFGVYLAAVGGAGDPASDGAARLTVAAGGSIAGRGDAVMMNSTQGSVITNAGVITGGAGYALHVTGAPATITNTGDINGRLLLTAGDDTLTNGGRLTLTGSSDFGAGMDTLVNSGTIRLAAAPTAQSASVAGLEMLASSGMIDLRNDVAGDRLTFADTAFTGSGAATLGLDVAFGNSAVTADQLGLASAAGMTRVVLNTTGTPVLFSPVTLVEVSAASNPDAFTLGEGSQEIGLIAFRLNYVAAESAYQLVSAPSTAVYRQSKVGEALGALWNRSADAVTARLSSSRDAAWAGEPSSEVGRQWFQVLGEANTREDRREDGVLGAAPQRMTLDYRQDAYGVQFGMDVLKRTGETGVTLGVTAGYLSSTTRFLGVGGDRLEVDAFNLGAYADLRRGLAFVNGLAKYDLYKVDHHSDIAGLSRDEDTYALGGEVEVGMRLGSAKLFVEPVVSLAYSRTSLDDFEAGPNAFDYDRFEGLRGKAGLRLGSRREIAGAAVAFYAGASAVQEFKGRDGLRFSSAGQVVALPNDRLSTFGQGTLGMNVTLPSGLSGFVEAHGETGDEYHGGGARAGLRLRF